jgi:hypothetical protein
MEFAQKLLQRYRSVISQDLCCRSRVEIAALEVNRLAVADDVFELMVTTLLRHRVRSLTSRAGRLRASSELEHSARSKIAFAG